MTDIEKLKRESTNGYNQQDIDMINHGIAIDKFLATRKEGNDE